MSTLATMPCLVGCLALAFPRIALVMVWLFGGSYLDRAYDSVLWPLLGFFFLPLTTLTFAYAINSLGAQGQVTPLGWVLVGLSVLMDVGLLGRGSKDADRHRRERPRGATSD